MPVRLSRGVLTVLVAGLVLVLTTGYEPSTLAAAAAKTPPKKTAAKPPPPKKKLVPPAKKAAAKKAPPKKSPAPKKAPPKAPAPKKKPTPPARKPAPKPAPPPEVSRLIPLENVPRLQGIEVRDNLALSLLYRMGYNEKKPADAQWKMMKEAVLGNARLFEKTLKDGNRVRLELATRFLSPVSHHLVICGTALKPVASLAADVTGLEKAVPALVKKQQAHRAAMPLGERADKYIHRLSYVGADRALGMLKLLGYQVVEMGLDKVTAAHGKAYAPAGPVPKTLPIITRFIDADDTSIQVPRYAKGPLGISLTPATAGNTMTRVTESAAQQRLLILYDPDAPDSLHAIIRTLREVIDVPARQILIEALVLEIRSSKLHDLGVDLHFRGDSYEIEFLSALTDGARISPELVYSFQNKLKTTLQGKADFEGVLRLLLEDGVAELLSNPSVLALNNHQARIRVGAEVPTSQTIIPEVAKITSIKIQYIPIGIVLNIKPRLSEDGREISMQVETIVSSEAPMKELELKTSAGETLAKAPYIDTRVVQTYARVKNGTPFIIGGLISRKESRIMTRLPILGEFLAPPLSKVPYIGRYLAMPFQREQVNMENIELIIVLTPHAVPEEARTFEMPKDSARFERTGTRLFRNTYRIRNEDVFDLGFLVENRSLKDLVARVRTAARERPSLCADALCGELLEGDIPGEDVLVRRMLYEIVKKRKLDEFIRDDRIIFFRPVEPGGDSAFKVTFLNRALEKTEKDPNTALVLTYEGDMDEPLEKAFTKPIGRISYVQIASKEEHDRVFFDLNQPYTDPETKQERWRYSILLQTEKDLRRLKDCLIMKRIVELNNPATTLHIRDFQQGRVLLVPNVEETPDKIHLVDHVIARFFFESDFYYPVFRKRFNEAIQQVRNKLGPRR